MKSVCDLNRCTGCAACVDICPKNAIVLRDESEHLNALINEDGCIHCGACERVCQQVKPIELKKPSYWFQGWINNSEERGQSSSGGISYALAKTTIAEGGYVAACRFSEGAFKYGLISSLDYLGKIRGSKYVKSNPVGIYKSVRDTLKSGKRVLFIGLPCHIAGLKRYIDKDYDNLITVDLICHGSPSPNLLESFLSQYNLSLNSIKEIYFRKKTSFQLSVDVGGSDFYNRKPFTEPGIRDRYTIAFLKGLIYTKNCYECQFAKSERVSDITIGDSWGSEFDIETQKKGISLVLCQTEKGKAILERCSVELFNVDHEKAIASNRQLKEPFPIPAEREVFFCQINNGLSFNKAVAKCYPRLCLKTDIRNTMSKLGIRENPGEG